MHAHFRLLPVFLILSLSLSFTCVPPHPRHPTTLHYRRQPTDPPPLPKIINKSNINLLKAFSTFLAVTIPLSLSLSTSTSTSSPPSDSFDSAIDLIRYSFYDNTGGALYPRTPQGIDFWSKKIRASPALEPEKINKILDKINDPFTSYIPPPTPLSTLKKLTLNKNNPGFLSTGAIVKLPPLHSTLLPQKFKPPSSKFLPSGIYDKTFPEVTAVLPNSLAERSGISTGTLILKVGDSEWFSGARGRESFQVFNDEALPLNSRYAQSRTKASGVGTGGIFGKVKIVVATPVVREEGEFEKVDGWRISNVMLGGFEEISRGNDVEFEMINSGRNRIVYVRLPNFSRQTTQLFVEKFKNNVNVNNVDGVVLDLRNNFGGVIQEAFMLAGGIIGVDEQDTVLAYTLDSRGAFRPQEVGEFFADHRFPGFFMSPSEKNDERRKGSDSEYEKPSSFKSLAERRKDKEKLPQNRNRKQKNHPKIVILTNEGTASSAEVFTAALRDNGHARVVGTRTYGKGLIQHIFPLKEGKLKLTIGEYLTPKLQHVSAVGEAKNANLFGGGIKPDVICRSEGIPARKENDLCVKIALEELGVENDIIIPTENR